MLDASTIATREPITLRRRGVETSLVLVGNARTRMEPDPKLISLIARAYRWFGLLARGEAASVAEVAERDNVHRTDVTHVLPLAFLAPHIVDAILSGTHPTHLKAARLKRITPLPRSWAAQRQAIGLET